MSDEGADGRAARERFLKRSIAIAAAWLLLGEWLAPELIRWLHGVDASHWWPPLARAITRAQGRHELAYYLGSWREDGRWAAAALLSYQGFALATRSPRFAARFVPPAAPAALGAIRALVASVLLASALWEHLPSSASIPRGMVHGVGPVLGLLYALPISFDAFVTSPRALGGFQAVTVLLLACAALGWRSRLSVPLAAGAYLVFAGLLRQYAWFYHTGLIPLYLLAVLAFTPCGDGFSLDRWLRLRRGEPVPDGRVATLPYGWARFLLWTTLALPYVEAGFSKLRRGGLEWLHADNLKSILLIDTLNPMQFDWGLTLRLLEAPDALFSGIGLATVAGEIGFGLVLFSQRARRVLPLVMLGMHLGIWLLQNVLFFDLIALQAIYYDWTPLRRWFAAGRTRFGAKRPSSPAPGFSSATATSADWPRRTRVLVGLLLACWALRIEEFPFTAMQMYSKPNLTGEIDWYAVVVERRDGERARAPIEAAIPALRDARYRRVIRQSFDGDAEKRALGEEFLGVFLRAHNAKAPPGERLEWAEAQRWHWVYARDPSDPSHGQLADRYVVRAVDGAAPR